MRRRKLKIWESQLDVIAEESADDSHTDRSKQSSHFDEEKPKPKFVNELEKFVSKSALNRMQKNFLAPADEADQSSSSVTDSSLEDDRWEVKERV